MEFLTEDTTQLMVALLIILILVKDIIVPIISRILNGDKETEVEKILKLQTEILSGISKQMNDLYDWHKPDYTGDQPWRGGRIISKLDDIRKTIDQKIERAS